MSKFCPLPWVGLHVNTQGVHVPCCQYQKPIANNLKDYLASPNLKQLQTEFLQGQMPSGCSACWQEEAAGIESKRQHDIDHFFNGQIPDLEKLQVFSLMLGNTCNLACRICSSYLSSGWASDEKKLGYKTVFLHNTFYKNPSFISDLKLNLSHVTHVTFSGGEVFYAGVKEHYEFLDHLIAHGAETISLNYITNTTKFPSDELWKRWAKFKRVGILLSIDATDRQFEYLRYPAIWEDCYQNIKLYQSRGNLVDIHINHTISFHNVFYLDKFYIWYLKEKLPTPTLNMVHEPAEFNIQNIPLAVKHKIKNKLSKYKIFHPVLDFMFQAEPTLPIEQIWNKIATVDQLRKQDFAELFSEYYCLFDNP